MQIGGTDINGTGGPDQVRKAFEVIKMAWPQYVVEYDSEDGGTYIYEDAEAYRIWTEKGRTDECAASLITLYEDPPTCVTELPDTHPLRRSIERKMR